MSNLIQETEQRSMIHICSLCDKSFPSGRSLGGHMRSHVINSTYHNHDGDHHHQHQMMMKNKKKQQQMKQLSSVNNGGSNPNDFEYESRKVKDSSELVNKNCLIVLDKLCKECGKGFQSWKALFGHMKCHSEKVSNKHNLSQEYWIDHSENENFGEAEAKRIKKSRSKSKTMKRYTVTSSTVTTTTTITTASSSISMYVNNNNNHASASIVSESEQDQEYEIAMCLIMLSRDEGKWGNEIESSDQCNSSAFVRLSKVEGKKSTGDGSKKNKKIAETQIDVDYLERSQMDSTKLEKIENQNDELQYSSKRKFECVTCNKSFHSYQALGGHKASHKKLKEGLDLKPEDENIIENKPVFDLEHMINGFAAKSSQNDQTTKRFNLGPGSLKKTVGLGMHECPICLKIFSSGQALGGHKRSHMINQRTSMNLIEKVNEPVHETQGLIDLNMLPLDSMEEEI